MVGTRMRSGGHNAALASSHAGDGRPESPRKLSPVAGDYFDWLVERLRADEGGPWARIDGCLIASLAELLECEARLGEMLQLDPSSDKLMRLRMQHSDRVAKLSALVGLCPRDRQRLPASGEVEDDASEWD